MSRRTPASTPRWTAIRPGLYYGWYIVAFAVVANFVSGNYLFGVFLKPMTEELGWSRGAFSLANTLSVVATGSAGFIVGPLVDRYGGRWLVVGGAVIAGLALMSLSVVHDLWQFLGLRGFLFAIGGVGMGPLVINVVLAKWFVRQRGRAISLSAMGISAGGIVLAPLASLLTDSVGWRSAWLVFGALIWVVVIVPAAFIMKRQPEDIGLLPDGDTPESFADIMKRQPEDIGLLPDGDTPESFAAARRGRGEMRSRSGALEQHWTRAEAVRTKQLWMLVLAYGLGGLPSTALMLHLIPFLQDNGFSAGVAALLFAVLQGASFISKPIWGYSLDRFEPRYLVASGWSLKVVPLLLLPAVAGGYGVTSLILLLAVYGTGVGCTLVGQEVIWAHYFGRRHIGAVRSVALPFTLIFNAVGAWFAGRAWDVWGSYTEVFVLFASLSIVAIALVLLTSMPRSPARSTADTIAET